MVFTSKSQKMMYTKIWEEIKKFINEVDEFSNYDKNYEMTMKGKTMKDL